MGFMYGSGPSGGSPKLNSQFLGPLLRKIAIIDNPWMVNMLFSKKIEINCAEFVTKITLSDTSVSPLQRPELIYDFGSFFKFSVKIRGSSVYNLTV